MNKLNRLIKELCPNGVEYDCLKNRCRIRTGKLNANAMVENGRYPFFTCDSNPFRIDTYAFDTDAILISGNGSQVGHLNIYCGKFNAYQRTYVLDDFFEINKKFLYYWMSANLKQYILVNCKKGSVPYITLPMLETFGFPVPPIPIQEEIVRILDNFTELTTELTTELQDRQKQYEYYRDSLLAFKSDFKKIYLGEIGKVCMCKRIMKEQTSSTGDVPFYKIGTFGKEPDAFISKELFNEYKNKYSYPKKGDILISCSGTIGRTVVFDGNDAYFQDSNIVWIDNDEKNAINRYLYYVYQLMPFKISTGGTIARLYNEGIEKAEICVPSLEVQERIVNVLDNFEKICNDLKIGLPAEIELRQKQYEYYRDMLLTFPKNNLCLSKQASKQASKQSYNYDEIKLLQYVYGYVNVELGELCCLITKGTTPRKFTSEGINFVKTECFNNGQIEKNKMSFISEETHFKELKRSILNVGDILITIAGATIGKCAIVTEDIIPANTNQALAIIRLNNKTMIKYIFYVLNSKAMKKYIETKVKGSAQPNLTLQHINEFILSIPSLEEQERIVSILDKFDKYCNDISEGLPAEIKYRQQQYEYYRDKLLTFKRLED